MKTSELLKKAKRKLAHTDIDSKEQFICHSIDEVVWKRHRDIATEENAARLKRVISQRLAPHRTLEAWLEATHSIKEPPCWYQHEFNLYLTKVQTTRHAWVKSMIAEYTVKGD
jgi:hypothetical protein